MMIESTIVNLTRDHTQRCSEKQVAAAPASGPRPGLQDEASHDAFAVERVMVCLMNDWRLMMVNDG